MDHNIRISPLAAALAVVLSSPVQAAEPIDLQNNSYQAVQQQFQLVFPGTQQTITPNNNHLKLLSVHTDKNNVHHIRLQQQYQGFAVDGGYAIFHSKEGIRQLSNDHNVSMNGTIYSGLQTELGAPAADFVQKGQHVLQQFKEPYQGLDLSQDQVTPIVYIDDDNKAHWAYKVSVFVRYRDKIPARPTAIIDATTQQVLVTWNDVKTSSQNAFGKGFGGNEKMGKLNYGGGLPKLEITRSDDNMCIMENKDVRIVDMQHEYYSDNQPMQFACKKVGKKARVFWTGYKGDGYDRENGAYSPSNDALYAGQVIKHMYHDWYNVEVLTRDGVPMQLVMRVHYGEGYENAYWDGDQMTFGDGGSDLYPLVSLGVGSHEISHGFTEQHAGLEYYGQSGGMNESFSDMAAMAAEYYSYEKCSWMIGAEIMKPASGMETLRYMDLPSKDGSSIDSADQYHRGLDVHYSSGVYNRLFYTLSNQEGWNAKKAFDVMVKANMDYWAPRDTFNAASCGVLHAAQDLGYSLTDVKKSLDVVAVKYTRCNI